jgi:hypothetical protein
MNNRNRLLAAALVLALVTMACGVNINLPVTQAKTGPTETMDIQIAVPEDSTSAVDFTLEFGAGEMKLAPGAEGYLAAGTATYNVPDFEPEVETGENSVKLSQGDLEINGIPNFRGDVENEWDLQLGNTPMNLKIKAGAYSGTFELGGLSLEELEISDGASDVTASFSEPNNAEMTSLTYSTGASDVELKGLANANAEDIKFTSGAGTYTLSFDGELQRDVNVEIESGVSTVTIIIPEGVNAKVIFEGSLSTVDAEGGWDQSGDVYTLIGSGPAITITVTLGAGTLNLKTE